MAKKTSSDSTLKEGRDAFEYCSTAPGVSENRETAREDLLFARASDQWDLDIKKQRLREGRPCLTVNKLPTYIRQVVNDARQNKPSIKVHPADSGADPDTAEVINGLIRNIEYTSSADTAYDTGIECAVSGGFGYWRVVLDYAYEDAADLDLLIRRVSNPFSVYGDPASTEADSSDWDVAFVVDRLKEVQFKRQYPGAQEVDFDAADDWADKAEKTVQVAEWWSREQVDRPIVILSDGSVHDRESMESDAVRLLLSTGQIQVKGERITKACKVTQRFMSGSEILDTKEWLGRYIPIVPVYGDEFDIEGRRYFRSLVHNAIDAQRMLNYWRTAATEMVALAPKVPFIGPKGAFDSDIDRWNTSNSQSHPFLEYDGQTPPQRQPLDMGAAAGALQEALNASDDIKAIIGLYDASMGARSNETSGRAIMARQREGDVSTFHFIDNMARAIRHTGRILIDMIPKVYSAERIVRVIGEDGEQDTRPVNQQYQARDPKTGQPMRRPVMAPNGQPMVDPAGNPLLEPIMAMHDLTAGKYDLTVTTGPSFTTRREEAAAQMTEMIRAFPESAPIVGPELAKNLDWPGADKIAEKMEALSQGKIPDQAQKAMQDMQAKLQQLTKENQKLKQDKSDKIAEIQADAQIEQMKIASEQEIAELKLRSQENIEFFKAQAAAANAAEKNAMMADIAARKAAHPNQGQSAR